MRCRKKNSFEFLSFFAVSHFLIVALDDFHQWFLRFWVLVVSTFKKTGNTIENDEEPNRVPSRTNIPFRSIPILSQK